MLLNSGVLVWVQENPREPQAQATEAEKGEKAKKTAPAEGHLGFRVGSWGIGDRGLIRV